MLSNASLRTLFEPAEHVVSAYLPLDPEQHDIRPQRARLREILQAATEGLERRGLDARRRRAVLAPLEEVAVNLDLVEHREPAIALFLHASGVRLLPLPQEVPFHVAVARHACIKPLLPMMARHRRFWLLALSAGRARLFSVTPFERGEVPLALERSPSDAAEQPELREETAAQEGLLGEIQRVAEALKARLSGDSAPLLLAAEPKVSGHFRRMAPLPQLLSEGLSLNPHAFSPAALQERALTVIRPLLESESQTLIEKLGARLGAAESTVAIRLEEILHAAEEGRIDAVAVASDTAAWGRFDRRGGLHEVRGTPGGMDEDLLNQVAVSTLRNGGRAFALPRERIPRASLAAALLRY
ncbi:hypothetical protein E0493_04245 [Roseomonas sp. M0104]|uniref:Uncharacterized protein n=1 Tax=Teichococcus coralli TaxID=2545983 RepID=A0A845B4I0_9PROT|nr:hypothetical protein [Pseudoroseomonas coralli]MXP62563.1 hypothetical protein [Pseudoroseomonas coralli]